VDSEAIWNPQWQGEIDKIESVHHRVTKIPSLMGYSQEARNNLLNLRSLEYRRRCGDLIQMLKLVKNIDLIDLHNLIKFFNSDGHNFFTNRVANDWNDLTQEIIESTNVNKFKN
jgi:hypothetical protein